jgi:hypothetical protein
MGYTINREQRNGLRSQRRNAYGRIRERIDWERLDQRDRDFTPHMAGELNKSYRIDVNFTTSEGNTLEGYLFLVVDDD